MARLPSIGFALAVLIAITVTPLLVLAGTSDQAATSTPSGSSVQPIAPRRVPPAGARFEPGIVPFVVNADSAPAGGLDAVIAAADHWNALELGVELRYGGTTQLSGSAADTINVVSWAEPSAAAARFVAVTSNHWRAASPQILTGFDMVLHRDRPFATDGSDDAWDVETVALHEFGHVIGLGHADADRIVQVMHPQLALGELNRRLTARDVDLARSLYQTPLLHDTGLFALTSSDALDGDASGGLFD